MAEVKEAIRPKIPLTLKTPYRSQVIFGHSLLAVGAFMACSVPKPSLWLLEDWGGLHIDGIWWGMVMVALGGLLSFCKRVDIAIPATMFAGVLCFTLAAAAYLALGLNFGSILAFVLFIHCIATARDLNGLRKAAIKQARNTTDELE